MTHLCIYRIDGAPVSEACKHLIRRIFCPCPLQRITVQEILQHPWFLVDLPVELSSGDWNGQVVQSIDFAARAEDIRMTVRAALQAVPKSPPPSPKWVRHHASGSMGECSDRSDVSEGAIF